MEQAQMVVLRFSPRCPRFETRLAWHTKCLPPMLLSDWTMEQDRTHLVHASLYTPIFQQEAEKKSPCNFPRASALVTARASTQLEPKISNFAPEIKLTGRTIFASSPVGLIEDDVFDAGQPQTHLDAEMHESTRSSDHDCLK